MKRTIGYIMLSLPFIGLFVYSAMVDGIVPTLLLYVSLAILVVFVYIAAKLIE